MAMNYPIACAPFSECTDFKVCKAGVCFNPKIDFKILCFKIVNLHVLYKFSFVFLLPHYQCKTQNW